MQVNTQIGFKARVLQKTSDPLRGTPDGAPQDREMSNMRSRRKSGFTTRLRENVRIRRTLNAWSPWSISAVESQICAAFPNDEVRGLGRVQASGGYNLVVRTLPKNPTNATVQLVRFTTKRKPLVADYIAAGVAASVICAAEGVPTPVCTGPYPLVVPGCLPFRAKPRFFSTLPLVTDAKPLFDLWPGATVSFKRAVLQSLAEGLSGLFNRPFEKMGSPYTTADGKISIGPICSPYIDKASRIGRVNKGPYDTWADYARSLVGAYKLIYRHHCGIVQNLSLLHANISALAASKGYSATDKFYLAHPDLHDGNILVDAGSGQVRAIIDWDGAVTEPLDCVTTYPPYRWHTGGPDEDKEDDELLPFFVETLRARGCSRWADALDVDQSQPIPESGASAGRGEPYDAGVDFARVVEMPLDLHPTSFGRALFFLLKRLHLAGIIPAGSEIAPAAKRPRGTWVESKVALCKGFFEDLF
ncbi:hypothetical protein HDU87_005932 [Geranomyces variabilis]|uniref:Aminoglycoside phosphotransferase domain-containing protein n=1 Tax=Geranomyces variabilis TaxID=109894 RepID=A0AAD5TQ57_9FUNG|nr:hypothetical protein HDU87_005932 [Geranomyces variabilis]